MNLAELEATFRTLADDVAEPYLWEPEFIAACISDAQKEAAIRSRLLHESASTTICQIAVTAGTSVYPLHASLYEIDYLAFKPEGADRREPVRLKSRAALDEECPDWREKTGQPEYAIQSDTMLRLVPTPEKDGMLFLEGYRLPLKDLKTENDKPEIHTAHHIHLVQWALHKAFSVPDADKFDATKAQQAEQEFTRYFGLRPDADLRRASQEDVPHVVKAFMP